MNSEPLMILPEATMITKNVIDSAAGEPSGKLLLVIGGPTASGKTALGIRLARHYKTVILSADSRQFYAEMRIGTARPDEQDMQGVKHYFLGDRSISNPISAGGFGNEARLLLVELFKEHHVVIAVGGSGLYLDALLGRIDDLPGVNPALRAKLNQELHENGLASLVESLNLLDPVRARGIDLKNPRRVVRALELVMSRTCGEEVRAERDRKINSFEALCFYLNPPREQLYRRIHERIDEMLQRELEEEARKLLPHKGLQAMQTVGYREWWAYFDGQATLQETVELIRMNTRRYAKRQLTWFRNHSAYNALDDKPFEQIISSCSALLGHD